MNTNRSFLARVSRGIGTRRRLGRSSTVSILLLAAACSGGHLDGEMSERDVSPAGAAEAGSGLSNGQEAPRETPQGSGLSISGDAELLTNLTFPDGSEVAFLRIGSGFLLSELVAASSAARTKGLSAELTPVERFERLAPELQVPDRLLDAQLRLGWTSVRSEVRAVSNDARVHETPAEVTVQEERSEVLHGLQAFNNCDAATFVDDACGDVDDQDLHWQQTNQNDNASKNRSDVWRGQTNVCAKTGTMFVRLVIENTDIYIIREITAGQADLRHWQMGETCSEQPWWCWPLCFPEYCFRNAGDVVHSVYRVSGTDRFHWCGFYEDA